MQLEQRKDRSRLRAGASKFESATPSQTPVDHPRRLSPAGASARVRVRWMSRTDMHTLLAFYTRLPSTSSQSVYQLMMCGGLYCVCVQHDLYTVLCERKQPMLLAGKGQFPRTKRGRGRQRGGENKKDTQHVD